MDDRLLIRAGVHRTHMDGYIRDQSRNVDLGDENYWVGRISATLIALAGVVDDSGLEKVRQAFDEHAIVPMRVRAKVGQKITWTNNGKVVHRVEALDGSWSTQPIAPGRKASFVFRNAGEFTYSCKEHPWSYAQIVIEE